MDRKALKKTKKEEVMRKVFLGLFCLSFVSSMAWTQHPEDEPNSEAEVNFNIEDLGFSFQTIKAGSFTMGENQVEVTISEDFEMLMTEVTQMQYFLVTRKRPSYFSGPEYCENYDEVNKICPDHPVERVSVSDAKEFIRLLNASAGIEDCEGTAQDSSRCYRLPTVEEFEWAAKAGTKTAYFFGNNSKQLGDYAVYRGNSGGQTQEVTTGWRNLNKLHGMLGNVGEWTENVYKVKLEAPLGIEYKYGYCLEIPDAGLSRLDIQYNNVYGYCRDIRGGSWRYSAEDLRLDDRKWGDPGYGSDGIGFRFVRTKEFLISSKPLKNKAL